MRANSALLEEFYDNKDFSKYARQRENRAKKANAVTEGMAREHELIWLDAVCEKTRKWKPTVKPPKLKEISRITQTLWSDHHNGMYLCKKEFPWEYKGKQEARRIARLVEDVIEYKPQYRNSTPLVLHMAGDMYQGALHDPRDGAPLAAQKEAAFQYYFCALQALTAEYPRIDVYCTPGNHGRDQMRHPGRAVAQKWDSDEWLLYRTLAIAMRHYENISFHVPRAASYEFKVFNHKGRGTHGDTEIALGSPGKIIRVEQIRSRLNKWSLAHGRPYDLVVAGHVHTGTHMQLPEGTVLVVNGCLPPFDYFSRTIDEPTVTACQAIWESTPKWMVGDLRFINFTRKDDESSRLDGLILPYDY